LSLLGVEEGASTPTLGWRS